MPQNARTDAEIQAALAECRIEYDRVGAKLEVLSAEQERASEGVEEGVASGTLTAGDAKQVIATLDDIKKRRALLDDELERLRDKLEAIGQELAANKSD